MTRDAGWDGEIVGHRGAAGLAPENTLAACEAGLAAGADRLELDLRITADRILVVFHDARLGRFVEGGDRQPAVFRRHSTELTGLDVGAVLGRPGCFVPTFESLLDALGEEVLWNAELKGSGAEGRLCAQAATALLAQRGLDERCLLSSFHEPVLVEGRADRPGPSRALLVDQRRCPRDPVAAALRLRCAALHAAAGLADEALLDRCRAEGLALRIFTVDEEVDMLRFVELGVDGIVTDRPDRLAKLVGR